VSASARPSLAARLLHAWLRSGVRGAWRATDAAARRFPSLHRVPVVVRGYPTVYVDLRIPGMTELFRRSPHDSPPWEAEQQALLRRLVRPGDVAYDVGANVGLHSVFLSVLVGPAGRVHAFEANSELYETLRRTVGGLANCTLHEFGLAEADGEMLLTIPENREMASLGAWTEGQPATTRRCALRSVDSLLAAGTLPPADVVKCDIEGAELLMLRGARRLVDTPSAPIVLAEANAGAARALGYSSGDVPRFLLELPAARYTLFVEETPSRWVRATRFGELNQYVLAVPAARLDRWPELERGTVIEVRGGEATVN